jgi:hypothetical protein
LKIPDRPPIRMSVRTSDFEIQSHLNPQFRCVSTIGTRSEQGAFRKYTINSKPALGLLGSFILNLKTFKRSTQRPSIPGNLEILRARISAYNPARSRHYFQVCTGRHRETAMSRLRCSILSFNGHRSRTEPTKNISPNHVPAMRRATPNRIEKQKIQSAARTLDFDEYIDIIN